ncbi:outer membrane protein assembly factor BamB family protein [Spiroplasma endosymbiont of 'Nebria riversi']|uniref:outer membrane protein assembly factor BamB family protein n=1 Tax=Spiroplasma endosymbiont of 'Nebria riversi' TaxID=2792084 RepID=UPI001C045B06|nr:PQQ-binding-like beta-propeller repeat protein [Spiroplasma endosymbiont of 'Nebria riversi']
MKKLLSLLSTITMAGSGMLGIVANSPYPTQEQQIKLENINYKRQKRSNNENNKINITKIVITTNGIVRSDGIILNNKVYFGSGDNKVYEYDPVTGQQKIVIKKNGFIWSSGVIFNNKLYIGSDDGNVYEYDPATGQQKIVIKTNNSQSIRSSGVIFNNKIYFGSGDKNVYEYDPSTEQQRVILTTKWRLVSSGVVLNNKLYFGSADGNIYEYSEHYLDSNLGQINSDTTILNELNYLNPDLDISQLEIISKTNNSAIVKIKDNLNDDIINIYYLIKNEQNKIINLNELIKNAIFFKFRDENPNLKFKEINYIDTNNLNFSNTEITKQENSFLWSNVPKNVCSDREIINKTPNTRSFNVPACEYNSKSKLVFQITTGLTKTKQENKLNGWNINSDDEMKLTDFTNINNKNSGIINVLSNEFDLSNTNKQEQEMILSIFKEPADKFELNPNEKLKITYPVRIIESEIILNLKQKITGNITAKIIDDNNKEQIVTLSITEVMQILKKYILLPNEITIDKNNDKITFNGEAFFSPEREGPVRTNTVTTIV